MRAMSKYWDIIVLMFYYLFQVLDDDEYITEHDATTTTHDATTWYLLFLSCFPNSDLHKQNKVIFIWRKN